MSRKRTRSGMSKPEARLFTLAFVLALVSWSVAATLRDRPDATASAVLYLRTQAHPTFAVAIGFVVGVLLARLWGRTWWFDLIAGAALLYILGHVFFPMVTP